MRKQYGIHWVGVKFYFESIPDKKYKNENLKIK